MTIKIPLSAAAGALLGAAGWGMRGQIGHEIGALVPGALVGLVIARAFGAHLDQEAAFCLAASFAAALSIGGHMTYGQTLGLCHGPPETRRYWWGILGCAIKGSAWWGLAAALAALAMAPAPAPTRFFMLLPIGLSAAGLFFLLNRPFAPPFRYPPVYFSQPSNDPTIPRRESWAAIWGALLACISFLLAACMASSTARPWYAVALMLTTAGIIGGAAGFPLGEALQAWAMSKPRLKAWPVDWWKAMEMLFGAIAGACLAAAAQIAASLVQAPLPHAQPLHSPLLAPAAAIVGLPYVLWSSGMAWAPAIVDVPLLCGAALAMLASTGPSAASIIAFVIPTLAWGVNVARHWHKRTGPGAHTMAMASGALAMLACGLGAFLGLAGAAAPPSLPAAAAFWGLAWLALTWLKTADAWHRKPSGRPALISQLAITACLLLGLLALLAL